MRIGNRDYRTLWLENKIIKTINQPLLPHKFEIVSLKNYQEVANAIKTMVIRGAPAIGAMGAYGLAQAISQLDEVDLDEVKRIMGVLQSTRPTAYDLTHGLEFVFNRFKEADNKKAEALKAAQEYADASAEACKKIGEFGEKLIKDNAKILTHCNAGALATVDYGTALAPIRMAHYNKKKIFVFVDETRPRLQGARLTAWELAMEKIPHAVIADNAAGYYMKKKEINLVITGADRIAINGDAANKIGTYEKAVLAKENNIPFYIAAPISTFDFNCRTGDEIPIEEREQEEVTNMFGFVEDKFTKIRIAPEESSAKNPAFDVTPNKYISGYITEKGVLKGEEIKNLS